MKRQTTPPPTGWAPSRRQALAVGLVLPTGLWLPGGARAVGQAMARNPLALIIPCHRVLAAGGRLGGFSGPGGLDLKVRMLALEGVSLDD